MIFLTCPQCESELEIDDGFRGGVCRCFSCGTLMTVPEDAEAEAPESLSRPERPDQPGATTTTSEVTQYTTSSGRKINLSQRQLNRVPTAKRRRTIQIGVIGGAALISLVLIGAVIWGASVILSGPKNGEEPSDPPEKIYEEMFPMQDPYAGGKGNMLGLPAGKRTAVIIDASSGGQRSFDYLKRAAIEGAKTLGKERSVQILLAREGDTIAYPSSMTLADTINLAAMHEQFEKVIPTGGLKLDQALKTALEGDPDQITIALATTPSADQIKLIEEKLRQAKARPVIVMVDNFSDELKAMAEALGGQYEETGSITLEKWYLDYLDRTAEPPAQ